MSHCYLVLCRRAVLSSVITGNVVHLVSRSSEANAGVHITPIRPRHSNAYSKATWYLNLIPGPTGDQSTIHAHCSVTRRRVPLSTRTRNHSNLNTVKRAPTTKHFNTPILEQQDNRAFQVCSLNARSLRNKSTAFVDLVCDLRAELFTICESWLHDLDSAILSQLTLPGYSKLCHCPRADRRLLDEGGSADAQ